MKIIKIAFLGLVFLGVTCSGTDSEAPTVQITSPVNNSLVGGTVVITITASDNEGVEQVELYIDNILAATLTASPYTHSWITASLVNNSLHTLIAKAYDGTGNESLPDTVSVQVFNDTTGISIYIWLYDPVDRFYDSDIGDSIDCSYWLEQTILASGYTPERSTALPADLSVYDVIFVTLGWFRC